MKLENRIKEFLELYHKGDGISNETLKRLFPHVYPGDQRALKNAQE